jgi:hypothetical protein
MFANHENPAPVPAPKYRQELDDLYARRSAIDSLIESLEKYERCVPPSLEEIRLLSA